MRIAIDARNLTQPISGISRYIRSFVVALGEAGHSLYLFLPGQLHSDFADLYNARGITVVSGSSRSPMGRIMWGSMTLESEIKALRPDVFWGPAHRLSKRVARHGPTVLTIHDLVWTQQPLTMPLQRLASEAIFMRRAIRQADEIVCVSDTTKTLVQARYQSISERISRVYPIVVPPSPSADQVYDLERLGISCPFVLCVGTWEPRKNYVRAMEAFRIFSENLGEHCTLVIAGKRGWKLGLIESAAVLSEDQVVSLHNVTDGLLSVLYEQCVGLFMPSLYEGFGLPVIEAQAFGKPVIVSQDTSLAEIAGSNAIIVDPQNLASLVSGLHELMRNPSTIDEANRSKENAQRFSSDHGIDELLKAFHNARSRAAAGRPCFRTTMI